MSTKKTNKISRIEALLGGIDFEELSYIKSLSSNQLDALINHLEDSKIDKEFFELMKNEDLEFIVNNLEDQKIGDK